MKPFVTVVADYHEFDDLLTHFSNAGFDLEYEEIGCFKSELWDRPSYSGYHAAFFDKGKREEAKALIAEWQERKKDYFEYKASLQSK